jgi:hypothetical protein
VYVQDFLAKTQQPDEGVRHYLSRLKGVASHCNFSLTCTCQETMSYVDHITRFKLVAGLVAEEIKEDIIGTDEKTLEETVKAVEAKESAKRAKVSLGGGNSGQVSKVNPVRHGSGQKEREKSCPAFSKKCENCDRVGHFKRHCLSKKNKQSGGMAEVVEDKETYSRDTKSISVGEMAGLFQVIAAVSKPVARNSHQGPPHALRSAEVGQAVPTLTPQHQG